MIEPQRILLVGDLHASTAAAFAAIDYAVALGADLIIQLGDFGFWPRIKQGQRFLRKVERRLAQVGLDLWWLDGNHEDFDRLGTRPVGEDGRRRISDHVWHLPRGHRWQWGDTRWVAVGGAVSVDRYGRTEGIDWFHAEALTDEEASQIIAGGPADVMLAHDAPWGVPGLMEVLKADLPVWQRAGKGGWSAELLERSDTHQQRVRRVVDEVAARVVFHGHYHRRYDDALGTAHGEAQVHGLGSDTDPVLRLCLLVDAAGQVISVED